MARTYRAYDELFLGYMIRPKIEEKDADGYGSPTEWEAIAGSEVVRTDRTVSLVRRWIRKNPIKVAAVEVAANAFPKEKQTKVKKKGTRYTFPKALPESIQEQTT